MNVLGYALLALRAFFGKAPCWAVIIAATSRVYMKRTLVLGEIQNLDFTSVWIKWLPKLGVPCWGPYDEGILITIWVTKFKNPPIFVNPHRGWKAPTKEALGSQGLATCSSACSDPRCS